nr:uncharacterized protein LOC128706434 isoform X1 [Cherax quadricarinatus]
MAAVVVLVALVRKLPSATALGVPWFHSPPGEQQQEDVVGLFGEVAGGRLAACHSIILTRVPDSPHLYSVLIALQQTMTQTFLLYDVETFLKSSPPQVPLLRHPPTHSDGTYCVAYYILAPVTFLALALPTIPKTNWFKGATKYFVCYTGRSLSLRALEEEPLLLASSNTLYVSPNQHHDTKKPTSWALHLLSNCPFCRRGEPEIILRNRWSPGRGFQNHSDLFPDLYQDCNGHIFKAVALDFPPFSQYSSGNSTHPLAMEDCLDKRIVDTIAEVHNFTYQVCRLAVIGIHFIWYLPYSVAVHIALKQLFCYCSQPIS